MGFRVQLERGFGTAFCRGRQVVGIHQESESIYLAIARHQNGNVVIEKTLKIDVLGLSAVEKAAVVEKRWVDTKIEPDQIIATFPHRKAIVKNLLLPTLEPDELHSMVHMQAFHLTPLPAEEIVVDYQLLESTVDGYSKVAIVIALKKDVEEHLHTLLAAGVYPDQVVLDSLATLSAFVPPPISTEKKGFFVPICLDLNYLTLGIFHEGSLRTMRHGAINRSTMANEIGRILSELELDLQGGKTLIGLAGSKQDTLTLSELIRKCGGPNTSPVPIHEHFAVPSSEPIEEGPPQWSALGASLATPLCRLDLSSEAAKSKKRRAQFFCEVSVLAVLSIILVVAILGSISLRYRATQKILHSLMRQNEELAVKTARLGYMEGEIAAARAQLARNGSFLDVLSKLKQVIPKNIALTSISFERNGELAIQGTSSTLGETVGFVNALQAQPLFMFLQLRSSDIHQTRNRDMVDFQVVGPIGTRRKNRPL